MAKIYGLLEKAQLESAAADLTPVATGLVYFNTGTSFSKIYNGSVWKTFVETDSAQVLTNKDIDGGTASNTRRITVPKNTLANLTALTRKEGTFAYATDETLPYYDNGSALVPFAGGGGSIAVNIRGSEGAGTTTLTVANSAYQRFNLSANRTVVLPSAGVTVGAVYQMINPNAFRLTIQADDLTLIVKSWGDSFTLVAKIAAPVTFSDWDVLEKSVLLARTWATYTPTFSGMGTVTDINVRYTRVGSSLHIQGNFTVGTLSAANNPTMSLPLGLNIDTVLVFASRTSNLGSFAQLANTASLYAAGLYGDLTYKSDEGTDVVSLTTITTSFLYSGGVANTLLSGGSTITFRSEIPIAEWSEV